MTHLRNYKRWKMALVQTLLMMLPLLVWVLLLTGCAQGIHSQSNAAPIPHPIIPPSNTQRTAEVVILRYEAALNACNAVITR